MPHVLSECFGGTLSAAKLGAKTATTDRNRGSGKASLLRVRLVARWRQGHRQHELSRDTGSGIPSDVGNSAYVRIRITMEHQALKIS